MGRDTDLRNMAPKQRDMGDETRDTSWLSRDNSTKNMGLRYLLNKRWKNRIHWVQCESERVVAMSISINKQPIVLMRVSMPHSGYADHHVEKVYKTMIKMTERDKSMKIIGGDFNAEHGQGEGLELSAVGHYTLNKGNCRGEWLTQWLLENKLVALEHDVQEGTSETSEVPHFKTWKNTWTTS